MSMTLGMTLRSEGLWPPVIPSIVLVESTQGHSGKDAAVNRFLKTCDINEEIPVSVAREAGRLRARARRGSALDALVIALAAPDGIVLTQDDRDLTALAARTPGVVVRRI
ncbi:MAG: hypothetical protein ACYDCC_09325 [Actinomycetota bacterium]